MPTNSAVKFSTDDAPAVSDINAQNNHFRADHIRNKPTPALSKVAIMPPGGRLNDSEETILINQEAVILFRQVQFGGIE